jgi:hypothetical protein
MNLGFTHTLFDRVPSPLKSLSDWALSAMRPPTPSATTRLVQSDDGQSGSDQCKQSLIAVIEGQILPRLLDAHAGISMTGHVKASGGIHHKDRQILGQIGVLKPVVHHDHRGGQRYPGHHNSWPHQAGDATL